MVSQSSSLLVPFPELANTDGYQNLTLRAFGLYQKDLEIDFDQKLRPFLVTQILQCCTTDSNGNVPAQSFFWNLTVGKRIECLLLISTLGNPLLSFNLKCLNTACQKQMDVSLSIDDLANRQHETDATEKVVIRLDNENIPIRKPRGVDQLEWLQMSFTDETLALKTMIQKLILDNNRNATVQELLLTEESIDTVNNAMEEIDPLINFHIPIACPYCEQENDYEIDLEEHAINKLQEAQQNFIQSVHRLALRYHWSEQEIFSLPSWRRIKYLSLIEKGEDL